ncbi:PKD domain-containing protein [Conexibacter woesei]|uniref:PKD domain containing protein n=1 Tax=Conexibacter woesei (strain DSM 14684 / CCUG 47730 / CIP 108061 / JCM 11494 / NBRC 100937 / ID131577) TaxID=469383 RepID=D3FA83_CONWI|nr:PKD domain-containing protein [Conexibacter woesei]ADB53178.1 PKD domain containing protein [Conexibacter woesei DSM 14684]
MRPFALRRLPALTLVALAFLAAPADATVSPAVTLDGPSADVVGVDGVAMAEDGSGGLVYRKRLDGRVHVFVSRYVDRRWQPPQRVDAGQRFDSSWPAIGAGNGGRLVVTWIHQYGGGVQNRMFSASLDPGARSFQVPVAIDLDVREGLDAAPSLSMGPGGVAYLAYRVIYQRQSPLLPPGTIDADIRLQRYSGSFWSQLGQPVDRIQAQPQATPTPLNGPQVSSDGNGNAVVAWIEPDDQLVPRAYARRVFGQVLGNVLPASPAEAGGKPVRGPVDQLAVAVAPFGEAIVGFRQQPDSQSAWTRPRALVNMLPSSLVEGAGRFLGPRPVDGGGDADGPAGSLGALSVSVDDRGSFEAGLSIDASALGVSGDETTVGAHVRLDDGSPRSAPDPFVARGAQGSLAAAWKVDQGGAAGVGLLERRADGTPFQRLVSAPAGGVVDALRFAGSPYGSALVGFLQGREEGRQVVAASIDAPPGGFAVYPPLEWTRARQIPISWERAHSAAGRVTYTVQVDGEDVASGLTVLRRTLAASRVGDGDHELTVVATDPAQQTTTSLAARLRVDRAPPRPRVARVGRRTVRVRTSDGVRRESSGLARVAIEWGDGRRGRGAAATHRYRRAGAYRVRVTARDKAGNTRRSVQNVRTR